MKLRFLGVLLIILSVYQSAKAQKSALLIGTLQDVDQSGLVAATVVLLHSSDSSIAHYALTDDKGCFKLQAASKQSYILQISYMGYASISQKIDLQEKIDLGIITMQEANNLLKLRLVC